MTTESTTGRSAIARTRPERWFQPGDVVRMVWAWFIGALALVVALFVVLFVLSVTLGSPPR